MAFDQANLHLIYAGNDVKYWMYSSTGDSLTTIASATATTYFTPSTAPTLLTQGSTKMQFAVNDRIYIQASDVRAEAFVSAISGANSSSVTLGILGQPVGEIAVSTGTLVPYGLYHSTRASGDVSTIAMPYTAGQRVTFVNSVSTSWTINSAATAAGSINSTMVSILINAPNQSVELIAESTARWLVSSNSQPGTAIIGPLFS